MGEGRVPNDCNAHENMNVVAPKIYMIFSSILARSTITHTPAGERKKEGRKADDLNEVVSFSTLRHGAVCAPCLYAAVRTQSRGPQALILLGFRGIAGTQFSTQF